MSLIVSLCSGSHLTKRLEYIISIFKCFISYIEECFINYLEHVKLPNIYLNFPKIIFYV